MNNASAQVQLVSGGIGSAYTLQFPGVFAYTPGISVTFKANVVNSGSATIEINGLGAIVINKNSNQALVPGDIAANQFVTLIYDGTKFQMVTPSSAPSGFANSSLSNLTATSVNQDLIPNVDNTRNFGTAANAWRELYLGSNLYIKGQRWTNLATNNTLIGTKGNESFSSGLYNLGVGQGSGNLISSGWRNTVVGHRAGESLSTQSDNTFVGSLAGGLASGVGDNNTFLGSYAGYTGSNTGSNNTFLGFSTGSSISTGSNNSFIGSQAGYWATTGSENVLLGQLSGQNLTTGSNNTFIGNQTGLKTATQYSNSTAIGYGTRVDANNAVVLGDNANVGIGISAPGKFAGANRYLSLAATEIGVVNGIASLELIGNTGSYNTLASKIDFLGIQPVTNDAAQRARIEALSGSAQTIAGQLTFWTNNGTSASSIFERMRITEAGRVGIGTSSPATSSLFAVGASSQFQVSSTGNIVRINNVPTSWPAANAAGVLQNDGTGSFTWSPITASAWSLTGNTGTVSGTNFIGTIDDVPLSFRVNNFNAGFINSTGNMSLGYVSLTSSATGVQNTAIGYWSLPNNTTGNRNTSVGAFALPNNSTGSDNTALGRLSLYTNTGNRNTSIGADALANNSTGFNNVALGYYTADGLTTGSNNTFIGTNANTTVANITNATAIGANSVVSQSNSLILGSGANVGIGTSTPNAPLQFSNAIVGRKIVMWEGANNDNQIYGFGINSGVLRYQVDATGADHVFFAGTGAATSNELMRIKGTGNVGIGTSTPSSKLDVRGLNIVTGSTTLGNLNVMTTDIQAIDVGASISLGGFSDNAATTTRVFGTVEGRKTTGTSGSSSGYLIFKTNNGGVLTERMRIDNTGDVIIASANEYAYSTAKTKTLTISGTAFNNAGVPIVYDPNGARIYYTGGQPVYAPLMLPVGAIITGVRWVIFDNTVGQSNTGSLYRLAEGATNSTLVSSTVSVDNAAVNNHSATPNHTVLVNNSYILKWTPTDNTQSLYMCIITYTVTQAE